MKITYKEPSLDMITNFHIVALRLIGWGYAMVQRLGHNSYTTVRLTRDESNIRYGSTEKVSESVREEVDRVVKGWAVDEVFIFDTFQEFGFWLSQLGEIPE